MRPVALRGCGEDFAAGSSDASYQRRCDKLRQRRTDLQSGILNRQHACRRTPTVNQQITPILLLHVRQGQAQTEIQRLSARDDSYTQRSRFLVAHTVRNLARPVRIPRSSGGMQQTLTPNSAFAKQYSPKHPCSGSDSLPPCTNAAMRSPSCQMGGTLAPVAQMMPPRLRSQSRLKDDRREKAKRGERGKVYRSRSQQWIPAFRHRRRYVSYHPPSCQ